MRFNSKPFIVLMLLIMSAFVGNSQNIYDWNHIDTLLSKRYFSTARSEAFQAWQQAQSDSDGKASLLAAFYLSTIDYAYEKYPTDSTLARFTALTRTLKGSDRLVAYAFLYQTYNIVHSRLYYQLKRNTPSNDPDLKYPLWHLQRMEDTLTTIADSILAYADLARQVHYKAYQPLFHYDSLTVHPADSTLLGVLVQSLLQPIASSNLFTKMYKRIADVYSSDSPDATLWLELKKLDYMPSDSNTITIYENLYEKYHNAAVRDDLKAVLNILLANNLFSNLQYLKAEQLCLETEQLYPNTYGAKVCKHLRNTICQSEFNINYSDTESSKRSRLAVIEARNTPLLHFRLVLQDSLPVYGRWKKDTLLSITPAFEWDQTLPNSDDHLMHKYLVAFPAIEQGEYYLVAYTDKGLCYDYYYSSDIAFITYSLPNSARRSTHLSPSSGHIVDRETGMPLIGRRVTLEGMGDLTYNIHHRRCKTDKNGYFHFPVSDFRYNFIEYSDLSVNVNGHKIYYGQRDWYNRQRVYTNYYNHNSESSLQIKLLMTDRPIYRLGDTVHFCGEAYHKRIRGSDWRVSLRPAKNLKVTATFGQAYKGTDDTIYLTTDSHGRCWGWFVVPPDGENGYYELSLSSSKKKHVNDYRAIKVEAYRPPHFSATLSTVKEGVDSVSVRRMGQPVTIYGMAMSYSGSPMTGAKVKWEVGREKKQSPLQYFSLANEYPYSDSTKVNDDGSFSFTFTPSPSDGDTDSKATYVFTAHATVTDADGETHTCTISLHVSGADGYCLLKNNDLSNLTYLYNNFDHQPLKGEVHVIVQRLQQPDTPRTLDTMMAINPDAKWLGSEAEFRHLFPHLAFYPEEGNPHFWPVVETLFDQTTTERSIAFNNLPSSVYRISFIMPDGTRHDTVVNHVAKCGRVTGTDIVWLRTTPECQWDYLHSISCNVGDTLRIEMGSPFGKQPLYYHITNVGKIYKKGMMLLDSTVSTFEIPITTKMKDGCKITFTTVRDGRAFKRHYDIHVLRPDRVVNISTETFRNHLQPGEQEHWKLRLTLADSTNAKANLCLTMYDKSLEQYDQLRYGFWPHYIRGDLWANIDGPCIAKCEGHQEIPSLILYGHEKKPQLGYPLWVMSDWQLRIAATYGSGTLKGTIKDAKTMEGLIGANVVIKQDGRIISGARTDFDGNYTIKSLPAGQYEVEVSSIGYLTVKTIIFIKETGFTVYNEALEKNTGAQLKEVVVKCQKIPVIDIGTPESGVRLTSDDIARMPADNIDEIVATVAGVGYSRGEEGMVTQTGNVRKRTGVRVPKEAIAEIPDAFNFDGTSGQDPQASINLRKNFSTLAFFKPDLRSGIDGSISVDFTIPDLLTQWQLHGFAWTDDYAQGRLTHTIQTQKRLMVQPLLPRFLRQGDTIELRAKVANLTDSTMTVQVTFDLSDSLSSQQINKSTLVIDPHTSGIASMRLPVGTQWHSAIYKIYAQGEQNIVGSAKGVHLNDGELGILPVLSMKERVTTSRMLYIAGTPDGKMHQRSYHIPIATHDENDSLSITFTSNPLDYAIDALPNFKKHRMPGNIYLANKAFVDHITSLLPTGTEKERKRAKKRSVEGMFRLLQDQHRGGGWSWMPKGRNASLYVTEAVMQRLAQCPSLNADSYYRRYYPRAVGYLDDKIVEFYNDTTLTSHHSKLNAQNSPLVTSFIPISTLYTRSLYLDVKPLDKCDSLTQKAYKYYYTLCQANLGAASPLSQWQSLRRQCQLALLMYRMGDTADAVSLATRIKESAHYNDTLGMYWLSSAQHPAERLYERPVEDASFAVDVMADILHDWESVNRIQQWILSYRQGTTWRTDMATASAVAALLRQPETTVVTRKDSVSLSINGTPIINNSQSLSFNDSSLDITLSSSSPYPAWGALFYSHDTPIDSIRSSGTGISLRKTLSLVNHDGSLSIVDDSTPLRVGDKVRIHIDIYCQRDLDNMVLRDQRAAGLEPVSTSSGWRYNDGLSYYVDVRDDSFDCYIDRLNEGHYYVEYDLWILHSGVFSNGITTLFSAYAPEFRANTSSVKCNFFSSDDTK